MGLCLGGLWIASGVDHQPEGFGVAPPTEERNQRIVGGDPFQFIPWQVAVIRCSIPCEEAYPVYPANAVKQLACGGTIISTKYVMSAAHCTYQGEPRTWIGKKHLEVRAKEHDLAEWGLYDDGATTHEIIEIHNHPYYRDPYHDYDFSIFELGNPILLGGSSKAQAAWLPDPRDRNFPSGTRFVVSGWGALWHNGQSPNRLHHVSVPFVKDEQCADLYRPGIFWTLPNGKTERMICAGYGGIGTCQGDSGGPLVWVDPSTKHVKLIGVVSFAKGCAGWEFQAPGVYEQVPQVPTVFADVASVLSWVYEIIPESETASITGLGAVDALDY